jgi:hypothetical protein
VFAAAGHNASGNYVAAGLTFTQPLAAALDVVTGHVIETDAFTPVTHCAGPGHADPGYLCVYDRQDAGLTVPATNIHSNTGFGVSLFWSVTGANPYVYGEYTVTAP